MVSPSRAKVRPAPTVSEAAAARVEDVRKDRRETGGGDVRGGSCGIRLVSFSRD
jgi:hypothetical protein